MPIVGDNYLTKIGIQDKTALRTIVRLTCGILAKFGMNILKYRQCAKQGALAV